MTGKDTAETDEAAILETSYFSVILPHVTEQLIF